MNSQIFKCVTCFFQLGYQVGLVNQLLLELHTRLFIYFPKFTNFSIVLPTLFVLLTTTLNLPTLIAMLIRVVINLSCVAILFELNTELYMIYFKFTNFC